MYIVTLKSYMTIREIRVDRPYAEVKRVMVRQFLGNKSYFDLVITDMDGNLRFRAVRT